jgi:hypothetical protein
VPNPNKVMSLFRKGDFLMHGVVLQNRVFPPLPAMFHVKPFSPAPLSPRRDVSRETVLRKSHFQTCRATRRKFSPRIPRTSESA